MFTLQIVDPSNPATYTYETLDEAMDAAVHVTDSAPFVVLDDDMKLAAWGANGVSRRRDRQGQTVHVDGIDSTIQVGGQVFAHAGVARATGTAHQPTIVVGGTAHERDRAHRGRVVITRAPIPEPPVTKPTIETYRAELVWTRPSDDSEKGMVGLEVWVNGHLTDTVLTDKDLWGALMEVADQEGSGVLPEWADEYDEGEGEDEATE